MAKNKNDKQKKDYEIIRDSNKNVKSFNFNSFDNTSIDKEYNKKQKFETQDLSNITQKNKGKKSGDSNFDKNFTKKIWKELKNEEAIKYKNISEEAKDKFIQNMFGTDKERPKICYSCGQSIKNNYYAFNEKNGKDKLYICSICIYNRNYCINCGLPIISNLPYQKYCNYCKLDGKCDCCEGEYENKNLNHILDVKGTFCNECMENKNRCSSCGKPIIEEQSFKLSDGRFLCTNCHNNSLLDKETIINTYRDTIDLINRIFGISGQLNCKIAVIQSIKKINRIKGESLQHNCKYSIKNNEVYLIVPEGIREDMLIGIIASEYAKIIAPKLNSKLSDKLLKEDFMFWIQHIVLKMREYSDQFYRLKEEKMRNSRFFKWMNTIERSKGAKTVFSKIKEGNFKY